MVDFNFRLNRQGPQGPKGDQGEKGDNGNTPIFSEGVNTPTEYTLLIDYGNGSVGQTGNLRPPTENNGGTYLRYNVTEGQYEIDDADKADLDGNYGEVRLATNQNVEDETVDDNYAVSYELFDTNNQNVKQITDGLRTDLNQNIADLNTETQNRQLADTTLGSRIDNLDTIKADKTSVYTRAETNLILNGKANVVHTHTLSQITDAGSLAGKNTVDYSTEVTNKPTIGNGTITITQGGVTKGTFTTNQSGDSTIALDAGGGGVNFTTGTGLELTQQNVLNVKIDGTTITTNASGELVANNSGSSYYAGQGIDIDTSSDIISVKVDRSTIDFDLFGNLKVISSVTPTNMVTTDTLQDITGIKYFRSGNSFGDNYLSIAFNGTTGNEYPTINGETDNHNYSNIFFADNSDNTGSCIKLVADNAEVIAYDRNTGTEYPIIHTGNIDGTSIVYNAATSKCESRLILESMVPQVSVNNKATISGNTLSTTLTYWSDGCSTGYFQLPTTIDVASDYLLFELDFTLPNNDGNDSGIFGLAGALISIDDQASDSFANFFVDRYGYSGGRFSYNTYTQYNELYSNLSQSGTYKCRIEIDAGSAKLYMYDTSYNQWSLVSTITGCSGNVNYLIFGSQTGMGSYSAEATFNLANCGWTTDRNFTTLNNLAATTVNRQVQSINTSYLNVDANGQLTLSDDVIAKLNSIT
ncbi:MAG: hypothetical protein J6Y02_13190 [Pseudobutyrivibrio sp.]|nr:hypothetical protein [Pseudobutyrivibrio sp.]